MTFAMDMRGMPEPRMVRVDFNGADIPCPFVYGPRVWVAVHDPRRSTFHVVHEPSGFCVASSASMADDGPLRTSDDAISLARALTAACPNFGARVPLGTSPRLWASKHNAVREAWFRAHPEAWR